MRNRIPNDEELDITPMIDVTFLMLIFFMVASTMQGTPDLPVPPSEVGIGVNEKQAVLLTLLQDEGEPVIRLGDGPTAPIGEMSEVASHIERGVAEQKVNVVIKADRDLPAGFVEQVVKEANVEGVEAMYYGVQEPD